MKNPDIKQKGFTLIELIVTMGIIGLLITVSVVNFRSGQQDDILRFSASRLADTLRTAQSDAIGGRIPQGQSVPPSAYGVRVTTNNPGTLAQGIVFADTGTVKNIYDTGEEISSPVFDPSNINRPVIIIQSIDVGGVPVDSLDIAFTSPLGTVKFDDKDTPNEVIITLQHTMTSRTKTVSVNRLTGRIDAQY